MGAGSVRKDWKVTREKGNPSVPEMSCDRWSRPKQP